MGKVTLLPPATSLDEIPQAISIIYGKNIRSNSDKNLSPQKAGQSDKELQRLINEDYKEHKKRYRAKLTNVPPSKMKLEEMREFLNKIHPIF
jgi:hypothetical protein